MHYVSLIIEFLRGRPKLVFWCVALTQAALWSILPSLFFSSPPGDVPMLLAIGHEFQLGSYLGPPLAFWLGELAFRIAGGFGVYVLAQACVVVTYWAVFTLGRRIVGTRHAVLAVLLMVGIAAFNVPSPDFGPAVLAAPLWALALLHYWRAVGEGDRGAWFLLAVDLGLLLLANYVGLILMALMGPFVLATPRGREALAHPEPWIALVLFVLVVVPHLAWLWYRYDLVLANLSGGGTFDVAFAPGLWLIGALVFTHLGLFLLAGLASGWPRQRRALAPEIERNPVEPFARGFVYFFALMPAVTAVALVIASGRIGPMQRLAPLVVLSGLALVVAAGNRILLYRERLVSSAWVGLLVAPPVLMVLGIILLPWTFATDLKMSQPANADGQIFRRQFPAPHRPPARLRHRRRAHRAAGGARQPQPPACLFRLGAGAQPLGERRRRAQAGRPAGLAGRRQCRHAAGDAQGAISGDGGGSAARLRPHNARPAAADTARLGGDKTAGRRR